MYQTKVNQTPYEEKPKTLKTAKEALKSVRAIVFDLDGTLADTEGLYRRFWVEAARMLGYPMEPRHALMIRSMAPAYAEPLLRREVCAEFDYHAVRACRRKIMGEYIDRHGVQAKPGANAILAKARRLGLRLALATATPAERVRGMLPSLGIGDAFDAMACGDEVARGKPDPDLYLLALSRLSVAASQAIAVEDSPTGIAAANAAGLFSVLIPDQDEPDEAQRQQCGLVLPSLDALAALLGTGGDSAL